MCFHSYKPEGYLLSTQENREYTSSLAGLERAAASGKILEGMAILCDSDLTLTVDLGGITGIIPRSEAAYCPDGEEVRDIAVITRVGRAVCFKVLSVERSKSGKPLILLSRRQAQLECREKFLSQLRPGDIIDARITHLEHFGAFADIGCGLVSLMSIDCISVSRIAHPRDRFFIGMSIKAVIKSIDHAAGRVYISHKELLGSWMENADAFSVGQTVSGIVRSIEEYGIFVELAPNLAGLAEYKEDISVGQTAAVYIKNIIPERMKIKLVLIDSAHNEQGLRRFRYFLREGETHIDYWRYSPPACSKIIDTNFCADGE